MYPKLQQISKGFGSYSCELFSVNYSKKKEKELYARDLLGHLFFNWSFVIALEARLLIHQRCGSSLIDNACWTDIYLEN